MGAYYEVANGVVSKYYYAGSQRIAMRSNGTLMFILGDHLGSTSLTTDASGQVTLTKSYAPYGEVMSSNGSGSSPFAYTGEQVDVSGLTYLRARYYSPLDESSQTNTDTLMTDYFLVDALRMSS